jgi:predicted lipoprotein with Yx(FWY)xxD motif
MKKIALLMSLVAVVGAGSLFVLQAATATTSHTAAVKRAALKLRTGSLGKFLTDSKGRTLYEFEKDSSRRSACSGACASNWPPLLTSGKPSVGTGLKASKAGFITRSGGKRQATYGGHPLYRFTGDSKAGQTNGQDVMAFGAKWYVVAASGKKIDPDDAGSSEKAPAPTPAPAPSGYDYSNGY